MNASQSDLERAVDDLTLSDANEHYIIIPDGGLCDFWLKVYSYPSYPERVEVYTTYVSALAGGVNGLIQDDVVFDKLPPASQMAVIAKLDEVEHERRQARARIVR